MQDEGTAKLVARWVALGALFLIPLTPLIVASDFFFPFITGKAFYFRILIEIAVAAWVVLALLDKEYRPRFSPIGAAVVGFVLWMFIADAFAPNAAKAFWSNFERMEGWVWLAHLLGFFFAMSAVLRVEKKWRAWFLASLGVSVVISGYALLQIAGKLPIHQGSVRIDASLGNSAYLAIYLLFSVCVALWLALTEKLSWLKWSLIALAALGAVLIFFTETRGTILGLVGAAALAALLTALTPLDNSAKNTGDDSGSRGVKERNYLTGLTAGKHVRRFAAGALVLLIVLAGGFYLARDSSFVQENRIFQRIASISLDDGQTRFTIWSMAFKGVLERPLTGWGQEGFNYVFNKYYDPSLYGQEPWFDRAHNAFIDWLSAGGLPAFLLYLSLFGTALAMLWRSSELSVLPLEASARGRPASEGSLLLTGRAERIVLTAALAGYAVHNFFVFDNLYSYVYFFAILALIDSQIARPIEKFERAPELTAAQGSTYALPVAAAAALAFIWMVNIPGMQVAGKLITVLSGSSGSIGGSITAFEELAARPSFAAQEVREQLVSFASSVSRVPQATQEEKSRIASLAVKEMENQVASYPQDARARLQLAYAYRTAGNGARALEEIRTALTLSPQKENFWIEAGAAEWDFGDVKTAQKDFNQAYALGPQFSELAIYAAAGNFAAGDIKAADAILQDVFGRATVDSDILAVAYYRSQNWPRLINMLKQRTEASGANFDTWFSLAAAYYMAGDKTSAVRTINTAVARFPDAAETGAAALKQIEGK